MDSYNDDYAPTRTTVKARAIRAMFPESSAEYRVKMLRADVRRHKALADMHTAVARGSVGGSKYYRALAEHHRERANVARAESALYAQLDRMRNARPQRWTDADAPERWTDADN